MSSEPDKPFVSFYSQHNISPVAQDISDLSRHFGRRRNLYHKLGLAPFAFYGKNILECGPGSGYNSLYVLNQKPAFYHLVDGNPIGLAETEKRLTEAVVPGVELKFDLSLFEDFKSNIKYDLVLGEGFLAFQTDPAGLAGHLADFVTPGGVFVGTCADSVSFLSDMIRRLLAQANADQLLPVTRRAEVLAPYFEPHFKNLPGMSRPIVDWLLDNALQPFYGKFFSLEEAVVALENDFVVFQSSPSFATDWRWYKDMVDPDLDYNQMFKDQYRQNIHNFIDYTVFFEPRRPDENIELLNLCDALYNTTLLYQDRPSPDLLLKAAEQIQAVAANLKPLGVKAAGTIEALQDGAEALRRTARSSGFPDCGRFASFFGRGQQYVSFVRCGG